MSKNEKKAKRPTKYYNYEFDIVVTEEGAHRWYETTSMHEMHESFEKFVEAELMDLSDELQHSAAQALHDQWGLEVPVCSWKTLIRNASKHFAA